SVRPKAAFNDVVCILRRTRAENTLMAVTLKSAFAELIPTHQGSVLLHINLIARSPGQDCSTYSPIESSNVAPSLSGCSPGSTTFRSVSASMPCDTTSSSRPVLGFNSLTVMQMIIALPQTLIYSTHQAPSS